MIGFVAYVAHSKTFLTEKKLHVLSFPQERLFELFCGDAIKTQCGLEGILLRRRLFEGIDKFCQQFEKVDVVRPLNSDHA